MTSQKYKPLQSNTTKVSFIIYILWMTVISVVYLVSPNIKLYIISIVILTVTFIWIEIKHGYGKKHD